MALETLLAGVGGGLLRLAPEALKLLDRRNERKHELALGQQQMELVRVQGQTRLDEARLTTDASQYAVGLETLREVLTAQAKPTGVRWVDAANALVRPAWTYLVLLTWFAVKWVDVSFAVARDLPWEQIRPVIWTEADVGMLAMLGTFWFLDRTIRHQQGR